jgi:hypothetical protein
MAMVLSMQGASDGRNYEEIDPRKIRVDAGTQPREETDLYLTKEYAEAMASGVGFGLGADQFPPPVVFFDGASYWVADGYHRIKAAILAGLETILFEVRAGDRRDAVLYSVGANHAHGKRRSNADKRRSVLRMLNDKKWGTWSNKTIADYCKVSPSFVANMRFESTNPDAQGEFRKARRADGQEVLFREPARPAPSPPLPRDIPARSEAQQRTSESAFMAFVRKFRDRGVPVDVHRKTERLGVAVVVAKRTVYIVEPVVTVPAFKEAFATVLLARQEIDPKFKAVVAGVRTEEAAEWIALAAEVGVGFLELS